MVGNRAVSGTLTALAITATLGVALYRLRMAVTSLPLRDSKRGPRATIRASASLAVMPPTTVAATSSEALKLLPFNASLWAAETVSIVTIMEVGLIN